MTAWGILDRESLGIFDVNWPLLVPATTGVILSAAEEPALRLSTGLPHFHVQYNRPMPHLSNSVSGAIRTFSFWMANGTVGLPLLEGVDYSCIFREPSALEQAYAIFVNVLEFDQNGRVTNAKHAEHRAAQFILRYITGKPEEPPFQNWEVELHDPPPRADPH